MVVWNIAKAIGAAGHGLARASGRRKRRVEGNDGQQTRQGRDHSATILGALLHKLSYLVQMNNIPNRVRQGPKSVSEMSF
jgi:hypothetical protein